MRCNTLTFTRHAIERMFSRSIDVREIATLSDKGEVIADYPDDKPHPSALQLGFVGGLPVQVVVARDEQTEDCYVVTVYVPDPKLWDNEFRTRRN